MTHTERLTRDGLTELANRGLRSFFGDENAFDRDLLSRDEMIDSLTGIPLIPPTKRKRELTPEEKQIKQLARLFADLSDEEIEEILAEL